MQRVGLGLLDIFQDDRRFEDRLGFPVLFDEQDRPMAAPFRANASNRGNQTAGIGGSCS